MSRIPRVLITLFTAAGLTVAGGSALGQSKGHGGKDRKEQKEPKGGNDGTGKRAKQQHHNGKDMVSDKIKKDGRHAFHTNGKHTAFVDVKGGKIAGVTVTHADKGSVPVKKYKTTKKMAENPTVGDEPDSIVPVQMESIGTMWIGYAYIDDYGEEIIYWFPYDMILDGDTGAVEYVAIV